MIEDDVRTYLLTQTPITNLVGTDAIGAMARIYFQDRQQAITADTIIIHRTGSDHLQNLNAAQGYVTAFIEFDCISMTGAGSKTLGEALRGELHGYRGTMGSVSIKGVALQEDSDDFDPPEDGSAKGQYHVIQTYAFQYTESVPTFS